MTAESDTRAEDIDWSVTTWQDARRRQMRVWADLPLERVIEALEEMQQLAERLAPTGNHAAASRRRYTTSHQSQDSVASTGSGESSV